MQNGISKSALDGNSSGQSSVVQNSKYVYVNGVLKKETVSSSQGINNYLRPQMKTHQ